MGCVVGHHGGVKMMHEWFEKAGLTEGGLIPKGEECPVLEMCGNVSGRCPKGFKRYHHHDFSCALARAWAIETRDDPTTPNTQNCKKRNIG